LLGPGDKIGSAKEMDCGSSNRYAGQQTAREERRQDPSWMWCANCDEHDDYQGRPEC
jgi:hypothetical protein